MSDLSGIKIERDGVIGRLTIDRPASRNALTVEAVEALVGGIDRFAQDDQVRVVCLTGAGDKAFCAGADLSGAREGDLAIEGTRVYASLLERMARCPKPLVARLAGHCVGGGVGLLLSCDLAYAAADVKVGTPEVNVGLYPMMVGALLLRAGVEKKVLEMVYTGALLGAAEAEKIGLLTRVYPRGELDAAVEGVLANVGSKAPLALAMGRVALAEAREMNLSRGLEHLAGVLDRLVATEDAAEGMRAFAEGRAPEWKGR